jgi:hypothetical protein
MHARAHTHTNTYSPLSNPLSCAHISYIQECAAGFLTWRQRGQENDKKRNEQINSEVEENKIWNKFLNIVIYFPVKIIKMNNIK